MSPFGCTSVLTSTNCSSCCTAWSRWFSRSAVLWPPDCSVTIWALNWPMVPSVAVDRADLADDVVLRRLALRRVGVGQRVDRLRQRARRWRPPRFAASGCEGSLSRVENWSCRSPSRLAMSLPCAGRALHRVDRLQRGLRRLQAGDGAVLLERLRLQRGVDVPRHRPGDARRGRCRPRSGSAASPSRRHSPACRRWRRCATPAPTGC